MAEIINFEEYLNKREVFFHVDVNIMDDEEAFSIAGLDIGFKGGIKNNEDAQLLFHMLRPTIKQDIFTDLEFVEGEILSKVDNGKRIYTEVAIWQDIHDGSCVVTKIDIHENKNFKKPLY